MCSTPRPRTQVKGSASKTGSLLSNLNSETRSLFAERANLAQERRHKIAMKAQHNKSKLNEPIKPCDKVNQQNEHKSKPNLGYWLHNASLSEVFKYLFFGIYKQT